MPVKTAISIPDSVYEEAENLARQRGMSRSELFTRAVAEYVKAERFLGVRERLDAVYGALPEESELDPAIEALQARSLPRERW
jgi:metal-responsive CopG/Arc/MetJ family transcriptional regulator